MQGLHHQQQQLAGLLAAALPKDDTVSTSAAPKPTSEDEESARIAAVESLHRAIVFPHNSILLSHSATFLAHGFSQLLSDKSYGVRQASAAAYGALCAVLSSIPLTSNGRQNNALLGTLVDRFIAWTLPLLNNAIAGEGTAAELALDSLREFLNVGEVSAIERFSPAILKACQVLLEDERTSLSLLRQLLGVLTIIALRFSRTFKPHFLDIVDLLLGWALVPDLNEPDRRIIMDSFLQFQKHWVENLQFSLGLLSKFLGDMDALLHDEGPGTPQQFRRLLALLSCFSSVLQSTASGLLEMNLLEEIVDPLGRMVPRLLGCLSVVGQKFGWSEWITDSWKCLTLLAEILRERFSSFYSSTVGILFHSLETSSPGHSTRAGRINSFQVHGVLKTNLQLLSLQKFGLIPLVVEQVLEFGAPISQLRLHPNHLVTGSSAATYIFLLQHANDEVVEKAVASLREELEFLKGMVGELSGHADGFSGIGSLKTYSNFELFALIKFDLKVLLTCVLLDGDTNLMIGRPDVAKLYLKRSEKLISFIIESFNPLDLPIQPFVEVQVDVLRTLDRLSEVEFLSKCSLRSQNSDQLPVQVGDENVIVDNSFRNEHSAVIIEYLKKYGPFFEKALHVSSPLPVKIITLCWIQRFCETLISIYKISNLKTYFDESSAYAGGITNVVHSVLNAASDREPKVRAHVALVLKLLLWARLVHPLYFYPIAEVVVDRLGDPDFEIKNAFVNLLAHVLPTTMFACGLGDYDTSSLSRHGVLRLGNYSNSHWKQVFALKQQPHQLRAQQLVSILSFISQRWKVPLSSWIQRLVHTCRSPKNSSVSNQLEEAENVGSNVVWLDVKVDEDLLEKSCSVNNLAGAWWAIHEAARFCISMRLRTNLGGPTQTFAALERMLLDIAHLLQLDSEQNDGNLNMIGASGARLLPMRLLLDFVEALKKNVYNAYEGSVVLPLASRSSSLFFRANKKVCEEWFSRICEPMMCAGLALECHDATIQYCTLRLQELENLVTSALKDKSRAQLADQIHGIRNKFSSDVLRVLRHMALCLCKTHDSEALTGLLRWVSMTFSSLFGEEQSHVKDEIMGPFSWINGLVYQADCQYEKAAACYSLLLQSEESLTLMGSDGIQFVIARMIDSYTAICDWKSLESWLIDLQALRATHAGKSYSGALTTTGSEVNAIHALARYDEGDFQATWAFLDLTPKSSNELTLDPKLALHRSEQMLLQAMLLQNEGAEEVVPHELNKARSMLEETLAVLPLDGLRESAEYAIQLHCISVFEDSCKFKDNQDGSKQLPSILSSYLQSMRSSLCRIYQDCKHWLKVLRVYQTILPTSPVTLKLCADLLSLARKKSNLTLATHLKKYLKDHIPSCSEEKYRDFLVSHLQFEEIMLLHSENKLEDAVTSLWSFVQPCLVSSTPLDTKLDENILKAKACLKLSRWLGQSYSDPRLNKIVPKMLADFEACFDGDGHSLSDENLNGSPAIGPILEEMMGTATKLSTKLCPTMGKSWIWYASWCFSQARDSLLNTKDKALQKCSFSPILTPEVQPGTFQLTEDERFKVKSLILQLLQNRFVCDAKSSKDDEAERSFSRNAAEYLVNNDLVEVLVQKILNIMEASAGAPGGEYSSDESFSATPASQLKDCFEQTTFGLKESEISSVIGDLVVIWWSLRRRRVSLFGHAAHGFIQYLSFSCAEICDGQSAGIGREPLKQKTGSYTLKATLHILHILLNYGVELKEILEPALSTIPLSPWQEVTPQLFARLTSHPEKVVRNQLEGLVMMLAKQSPSSVVYPTLVDVNANEEKPPQEIQRILDCLSELYPRLVQDVQLMINELENVTVLWEELWLSTLQDLHTDVMRRINLLKEEAARIAENFTLSQSEKKKINAAKYSAMMAPIVVALERRLASTSRNPETPHEDWFHKEYRQQLKSAITIFKTPPTSTAALSDVWRPFDNIAASLASYQRKSSVSLGEVAPQLSSLSSSDVPIPGLEKCNILSGSEISSANLQGIITIASFLDQVEILPTKTKPKKLVLMGSDGQEYTYLLKGREDLRLDARIMQLLQAINGFLCASPQTYGRFLGIRNYSVTPISGRAGLIQWVNNVISIYSVFKSWQSRTHLAQLSTLGGDSSKTSGAPHVPRPSDMFYGKIIPALKDKGIRRVISRRDWPHDVKRKVLLDLMQETPSQLLHQELWCASEGFKAFSSKLKRYSGSVAAMSMVGHILGLGDRHLDNILVDFCSGDIVHIDYNVCFDKGQRLKVPEIVPFRLTHTLKAALGLAGIEGSFKANCEAVIGVLRKNKDMLLMLLEVFVWDPLVEWTRGDFLDDAAIGGEERKGMELAVNLSLFASRVQEIRVPLQVSNILSYEQEHHDLLLATLPAVESSLERFVDVLNQYELASALFYQSDRERSALIQYEASAKSIVNEATSCSEKTRASYEILSREFAQAKAVVAEKAQEATSWIEQHGRDLDALRNNIIPEISVLVDLSSMPEALSLSSAVLVAGVPLTIVPEPTQAQCQDIDREVSNLVTELDAGFSSCLAALQIYSLALQRILPLNYVTTSAVHSWAQVLQLSSNALSSDILSLAGRQAAEFITKIHGVNVDSVIHSHNDLCLQVENCAMEIKKLEEECSELEKSISVETELKAKDRLLSAFMKYMQSADLARKEDGIPPIESGQSKHDRPKANKLREEAEERKEKALCILNIVVTTQFNGAKLRLLDTFRNSVIRENPNSRRQYDFETIFCEVEEQVEKCLLVKEFVRDLRQLIGTPNADTDKDNPEFHSEQNWATTFKASLLSCKNLIDQMTEVVLPDVMKSAFSLNSDMIDAFGSISQIRGSVDSALEQLVEIKLEKASLLELEQNYFIKVGLITEQQLALEEAAVKGRDHLSWEEAEELASQEEACRTQLSQLHQTWSQRDLRTSSLIKREANVKNALILSNQHFQSLVGVGEAREHHALGIKELLSTLAEPFREMESFDRAFSSISSSFSSQTNEISEIAEMLSSGHPLSDYIWKFDSSLDGQSFFVWKIVVVDSFLDLCIREMSSSVDKNLGFEQLYSLLKRKVKMQLQEHIGKYLKERIGPTLLACLDKEDEHLKQLIEATKELALHQVKKDMGVVTRVRHMLEEYCNSHETARAARLAASLMRKQVKELREVLHKTGLEIVQLEWMQEANLNPSHNSRVIFQKLLGGSDILCSVILNLSRSSLMETVQSAISKIARSLECLQACEQSSLTAEGQLERAMSWACGGASSSATGHPSNKASGIPPEFHDHLMRRRKLLWEAREKASNVIKISMSILEFEASRDGILWFPGEMYPFGGGGDSRIWQQSYLNALARLDITFHSFSRAEQEWKRAQSTMEAVSDGLHAATNEVCIASVKAKSASDDLQSTIIAMRDSAYGTSVALSAFSLASRSHTALTSECGSMLEEVLAITEDLHHVHSLGKEAAGVHHSLMENLSKGNSILLPLETVLSKDVAAMTEALNRERDTKKEISPVHGQAIYQSYNLRIKEAFQTLKPLVPSVTLSVKGLYSLLTKLAQTASFHAGNLHKALEGLGESGEGKSQGTSLLRSDIAIDATEFDDNEGENLSESNTGNSTDVLAVSGLSFENNGWISPPESICSSGSESGIILSKTSFPYSFDDSVEEGERFSQESITVEASGFQNSACVSQTEYQEVSPSGHLKSNITQPDDRHSGSFDLATNQPSDLSKCFEALPLEESLLAASDALHPLSKKSEEVSSCRDEISSVNKMKLKDEDYGAPFPYSHPGGRVGRGKNPYALSVLRRVEMKLDGRDISDNREISISEQVDHLLKQATSIDNLCNMYEGWTPWI